jgi:hypothetical protein
MLAVVATHGHCFDGLASAVLFTQLMRHLREKDGFSFRYHAMGYGPGQNGVDPALFVGDENVILDYRYSSSEKLTWYFDHHVSAFPTELDRASYEQRIPGGKAFHDGTYGSCTKLIADVAKKHFDFEFKGQEQLIRWADIIDRAAFESAEMAVSRTEPVLQLMTVVENMGNDKFLSQMIIRLMLEPLEDVARARDVQALYAPMKAEQEQVIAAVSEEAKRMGDVVYVDLTKRELDAVAKFVTYALYPDAPYSVFVTRSRTRCKISVGFNPWCKQERKHNIAALCERYGGGGHPVVGAISTGADEVEKAKQIALEVTEILRAAPTAVAAM